MITLKLKVVLQIRIVVIVMTFLSFTSFIYPSYPLTLMPVGASIVAGINPKGHTEQGIHVAFPGLPKSPDYLNKHKYPKLFAFQSSLDPVVLKHELEWLEKINKGTEALASLLKGIVLMVKQGKAATLECTALVKAYQASLLCQLEGDPSKKLALKRIDDAESWAELDENFFDLDLLCSALRDNEVEAALFLIPRCVQKRILDHQAYDGAIALHLAVCGTLDEPNSIICLRALVDAGVDITKRDVNGLTVLHLAAKNGLSAVVQFLIKVFTEKGISVDAVGDDGSTAAHYAAYDGDDASLRALVDAGADVTKVNVKGWNAMHWAASQGNTAVIEFLLPLFARKNIHIDEPAKDGTTPSELAGDSRNPSVANILREETEKQFPETKIDGDGFHELHRAALNGNSKKVKSQISLFMQRGLSVDKPANRGQTALHCAARSGNVASAEELVKAGADVCRVDSDGWNALRCAASKTEIAMVKYLVDVMKQKDISINDFAKDDFIPIHRAAYDNDTVYLDALIVIGADVTVMDDKGWSAIHWAAFKGNKRAIEILIPHFNRGKIPINRLTKDGKTPIELAERSRDPSAATILREVLAGVSTKNEKYNDPKVVRRRRRSLLQIKNIKEMEAELTEVVHLATASSLSTATAQTTTHK